MDLWGLLQKKKRSSSLRVFTAGRTECGRKTVSRLPRWSFWLGKRSGGRGEDTGIDLSDVVDTRCKLSVPEGVVNDHTIQVCGSGQEQNNQNRM